MAKKKHKEIRPHKLKKSQVQNLCKKYQRGNLNITHTADKLGVSRRTIYFHLHRAGLIETPKKTLWQKICLYFRV